MSGKDPRKAETLGEACANEDGTYNAVNMLSWLTDALAPGKGVSKGEVQETIARLKNGRGVK